MKKILLIGFVLLSKGVFSQWHLLPPPSCYSGPISPGETYSCPQSVIIGGDGFLSYLDYFDYSPSSGNEYRVIETRNDFGSTTIKYTDSGHIAFFTLFDTKIDSFCLFAEIYLGNLNFSYTKDDFATTHSVGYCQSSTPTSIQFPAEVSTKSYIYFVTDIAANDSLTIYRYPLKNSLSLCKHIDYKYRGFGGVQFINDSVGYISTGYRNSAKNVLLHTTDYGASWSEVYLDSLHSTSLFSFTSNNVGYILRSDSTMIKTINGGTTWNPLSLPLNHKYYCMAFSSDSIGYLGSNAGYLLQTTDGGITWDSIVSGTTYKISSLVTFPNNVAYFIDSNNKIFKNTSLLANGIEENKNILNPNYIYPNPANNKITIDANNVTDVKLFDVLGKQISSTKTNEVDISNFTEGIYFIQVQTNQNTYTQKIIVQH